jgi:general secretion pathway protein G
MNIKTTNRKLRAFTLIEIMVVVIIIGILAATLIPEVLGSKEEAKITAAKADVSALESAVQRFYLHMDRYPTGDEGLKVLIDAPTGEDSKNWRGPYMKKLGDDPWGHPYQYACPGTHHPTSFDIWSSGKDGKEELGNW